MLPELLYILKQKMHRRINEQNITVPELTWKKTENMEKRSEKNVKRRMSRGKRRITLSRNGKRKRSCGIHMWPLPKHVTFRTEKFCCTSTAERLEYRQVQNTSNVIGKGKRKSHPITGLESP